MKKEKILILLALCMAGSTMFGQSLFTGRSSSSSPDLSLVNNQPKEYQPKVELNTEVEAQNKQLIAENLFVTGKLGIGIDMTDNTTVSMTTMIMKENNIRLLFDDTSASASFPANDWAIRINDTSNGADDCFVVEDVTASTVPFKIMAGAGSNALYVSDNGYIGLGTSSPIVELQIADGDSPTVRLEQDGSSGWAAQTWDMCGNEANFFVRDVTNGSTLPFRIEPSTPTSTLSLKSTGRVGVGTWAPSTHLDVIGHIRTDSTMMYNPLTEAPEGTEGSVYMDGNEHLLKVHNGTEWVSVDDDSQDLVDATLTGTVLQIDIENGASVSVDLQPLLADLEARVEALETLVSGKESVKYSSARLFQNAPNPYQNSTRIGYYIPETVESAILQITSVNGTLVKEMYIYERGEGYVEIDSNDTSKGTYFYSLIVDGQKLETKTLVKVD